MKETTDESRMKFCKDCKFYETAPYGYGYAKCGHPMSVSVDLVEGLKQTQFCYEVRSGMKCGSEGLLWEPLDGEARDE